MAALTWEVVDAAAEQLGASDAQRRKWRQRGREVPAAWRIRIAEHLTNGGTPAQPADFDSLAPRPGRLKRAAAA